MKTIARWESRGKKHWYALYQDDFGYNYKGNGCSGFMGGATKEEAFAKMEDMIYWAKKIDGHNMKRVV
jgi:hypothetical protein